MGVNPQNRFDKNLTKNVLETHGWAIAFGLLFPLLAFLYVAFSSSLWAIWPSVLSFAFEHVMIFGWGGIYLFGLLYILLPEVFDIKSDAKVRQKYRRWLSLYALGIILHILGTFIALLYDQAVLFFILLIAGSLLELGGWLGAKHDLFQRIHKVSEREPTYYHLIFIGMVPFTAALMLFPVILVFLFGSLQFVIPVSLTIALRFLPLGGLGLILLSVLIRLAPEMLDWRPLLDRDLQKIFSLLLLAIVVVLMGYIWFHFSGDFVSALFYALGAVLATIGTVLLFSSIDIWNLPLIRARVGEHVNFLLASFIWLMLSGLAFIGQVIFEITTGTSIALFFSEILTAVFFIGFIGQAFVGIYLYITHEIKGSNSHSDLISNIAFVLVNWALLLMFFMLPLMILSAWPGAVAFAWALNISFFAALLLISYDIFISLSGNRLKAGK